MRNQRYAECLGDYTGNNKKKDKKGKIFYISIFIVVIVISLLFSRYAGGIGFQKKAMETLDEKKMLVTELTALSAITATGIAAIPDDATTPVADQIADLSSKLVFVVVVIMFEKFLIQIAGFGVFGILFPLASILAIVCVCTEQEKRKRHLKKLVSRLFLIGIIFYTLVPISTEISNAVDRVVHTNDTISTIREEAQILNSKEITEEDGKSVVEKIAEIGGKVFHGITTMIEFVKYVVSNFMDAVAAILLTCIVIPILVLFVYKWLLKLLFEMCVKIDL